MPVPLRPEGDSKRLSNLAHGVGSRQPRGSDGRLASADC